MRKKSDFILFHIVYVWFDNKKKCSDITDLISVHFFPLWKVTLFFPQQNILWAHARTPPYLLKYAIYKHSDTCPCMQTSIFIRLSLTWKYTSTFTLFFSLLIKVIPDHVLKSDFINVQITTGNVSTTMSQILSETSLPVPNPTYFKEIHVWLLYEQHFSFHKSQAACITLKWSFSDYFGFLGLGNKK